MPNIPNRHTELHTLLTQLSLTGMADGFADLALRAAKEGLSHEAYLYELARSSVRTTYSTAHCTIGAGGHRLPVEKTFRTLSLSRLTPTLQLQLERLKSASFLDTATNIIAIGKPGEGLSHCLAAVGYELIYAGHPVLWTPRSRACPTTSGGQTRPAFATGIGEIGQIRLCHSR